MGINRVFLPQEALDGWLADGKIALEGSHLTILGEARTYELRPAVRFLREVGGSGDGAKLVGRIKEQEQLTGMKAEHYMTSVLLGESAYEVQPGFVGYPSAQAVPSRAKAPAKSKPTETTDQELLTKFLLENL